MNNVSHNAIAGPSNIALPHPSSTSSAPPPLPSLFLPPPAPTLPPALLTSTQDLLSRFHLLPAYDKYVRPHAAPTETGLDQVPPTPITSSSPTLDKGKGREIVEANAAPAQTPGDGGDGDDDDATGGKNERKKKNSYKHLIKGAPGKHSFKKDDYLSTMMLIPPKQRIQITPFDPRTQVEAFTVSPEGLKGWNPSALIVESAQVREDRKKRKELRRLAKLQAQQAAAALANPSANPFPSQPALQAPIPTSASAPSALGRPLPVAASTPRATSMGSGTPRPGSTGPRPGSTVPRPGSTVPANGGSGGITIARPGSAVSMAAPRNVNGGGGAAKPSLAPVQMPGAGKVGTPHKNVTPISAHPANDLSGLPRGKKRERGDSISGGVGAVNGVSINGHGGNTNGGTGAGGPPQVPIVVNARPGMAGVRPRPAKRQKADISGHARDMTNTAPAQQQPTPQGV